MSKICVWILGAIFLLISAAHAQEAEIEEETSLLNYAFATQLGSGIYSVSGRTIQIYRISFSHQVYSIEDHSWGLKLLFPVTLGFYDFKLRDVLETGLPENFGTSSIMPGAEFQIPILLNWTLIPFAEAGVAADHSGKQTSFIYAGGVKSLVLFPLEKPDYTLWNELRYAGYNVSDSPAQDDLFMFETGLDARWPMRFTLRGQEADFSIFLINYVYFSPTEFLRVQQPPREIKLQYEVGFTFGTSPRIKIWKIKLPRIGLSYRFGDSVSAVRLVFGNQF